MTGNRLREALEIRRMKQSELCAKTGIKKTTMNSWYNQKSQPKRTPLYLMARALNVSEMWLAGYDCPMERPLDQIRAETLADTIYIIENDDNLAELVIEIGRLDKENRKTISDTVKRLLAYQEAFNKAMKGGKK